MRASSDNPLVLDTLLHAVRAFFVLFFVLAGCHRNMEPFVEGEEPRIPDLVRIFPDSSADAGQGSAPAQAPAQAPTEAPALQPASRRGNVAAPAGISGTITVLPELVDRIRPTGTLFVIARQQGVTAGPPLAVLKIPDPRFPVAFEIGQDQVMIPGVAFAGEIQITARLDSDGNAMTKLPGDLAGAATHPASPGTTDLNVILDTTI